MKHLFVSLFLFCTLSSYSQQYLDKKIIIHVDTSNIHERIKFALGKHTFQMVEDGNDSVITTYPRDLRSIPGYALAKIEVKQDSVILSGIYGFIRQNYMGYTRSPNSYKDILYMKGSKLWPLLMSVAKEIGNDFKYSK
jgi:hypothetical protein